MIGTAQGSALLNALRRSERQRRRRGLLLATPLLAFLLVFFLVPILGMLAKSIENAELRTAMPQAAMALEGWSGQGVPPEEIVAVFANELRGAQAGRLSAQVAQRLGRENPGWRGLIMDAARRLNEQPSASSWTETLEEIDPAWADPMLWAALRRAAQPWTDSYLLAAVDLDRDVNDMVGPAAPDQRIYLPVLGRTLGISVTVTLLCLLLGYPLAYRLATLPERIANPLMILVLLPFWTSLLVRTSSWVVLLEREGLINQSLTWLGLISQPLSLAFNRAGVLIAMTQVLLPFMILPLYRVMRGIDPSLPRAAKSLGAGPFTAFRRIWLPLSMPGVGAGCLLVFILSIGYYITPALVGSASDQMISYFIAFFTLQTINWGMAASLGSVLLAVTLLLYWLYARLVGLDRLRLG